MKEKIDGNKIADKIIKKQKKEIKKNLKVAVVLVGENPASISYIKQKEKLFLKANIKFSLFKFSEKTNRGYLIKEIKKICKSSSGVIIQLPLPFNYKNQEILDSVSFKKDIDLLSTFNLGKFYSGDFSMLPPVVGAVNHIFNYYNISVKGANISLFGFGKLVGKPLSFWLSSKGATVSVINELTKNPSSFSKNSDIIISGVGKNNLIKGNMVKKGVIAIDGGSSFYKGKIVGDFDKSVYQKSLIYTPVPGGLGPITTACLIENLVKFKKI